MNQQPSLSTIGSSTTARSFELDKRIAQRFLADYPIEAARVMDSLPAFERIQVLQSVSAQEAANVLRYLNRFAATECLKQWPDQQLSSLLGLVEPQFAARLFRGLETEVCHRILSNCEEVIARPIKRMLKYPEDSAGALMDPNVFSVEADMTVLKALELIRRSHSSVEDYIYVVDRRDVLTGVTSLRTLLEASPDETLDRIKHSPVAKIMAQSNRSRLAEHEGWARFHAMPVVDRSNILLGVIGSNTLFEIEGRKTRQKETPFLLAIAEMYWTMVGRLLETLLISLPAGPEASESDR